MKCPEKSIIKQSISVLQLKKLYEIFLKYKQPVCKMSMHTRDSCSDSWNQVSQNQTLDVCSDYLFYYCTVIYIYTLATIFTMIGA